MVEGFWIVQFEGVHGGGGGVVFLRNGTVLGGDSGYIYEGKYETNNPNLRATVSVKNFLPGVPNVLGVNADFDLVLEAKIEGDTLKGRASLASAQGMGLAVKLTRRAPLP